MGSDDLLQFPVRLEPEVIIEGFEDGIQVVFIDPGMGVCDSFEPFEDFVIECEEVFTDVNEVICGHIDL